MLHLNQRQEQHVLRYLINHKDLYIDAGASRMVFECTTDICDYLKLPDSDCTAYIIKVALGRGGMEQNKVETETYEEYENYNVLAEIVAVGRYIEIMENVDVHDFRDEADWGYGIDPDDLMEEHDYLSYDEAKDISETIEILHDIFGVTSDNGQLGKTVRGTWVAFDYGYIPGKGNDIQTSSISDYVYREATRVEYMSGLINLLDDEEDFMIQWEKEFLDEDEDENESDYCYNTADEENTCSQAA